jgi:hypothetical protein
MRPAPSSVNYWQRFGAVVKVFVMAPLFVNGASEGTNQWARGYGIKLVQSFRIVELT